MKRTKDNSEKNRWRIKVIHFQNPYSKMDTNWGALLGAILFIGGIFAGLKEQILFSISVIGIGIALTSIFLKGRATRQNWIKIPAQCKDKEWKNVIAGANDGQRTWAFRLLCEFEFDGKRYRVTPRYWSTFISEKRLERFLNNAISPQGRCHLLVNPKNPLQTELVANDIKDYLINSHIN